MASIHGTRVWRLAVVLAAVSAVTFLTASESQGQGQFGAQARANAASQMIILGVQQGISSLPPTSGQSFTYQFDPELSTFVASEQLGPTSFRSPETVGKNKWALRASYSYFELEDTFGPIDYLLEFDKQGIDPLTGDPAYIIGVSGFGLKAKATVNLTNLGFNYGITDRLEFMFNVPITVVKANAYQISAVTVAPDGSPTMNAGAAVAPFPSPTISDQELAGLEDEFAARTSSSCNPASGACIAYRTDSFNSLGNSFNDDTSAGVGRISLGAKYLFYAGDYANLAASLEFFNPSPSEDDFAGSESPAILPRFIMELPGKFRSTDYFRLHGDLGYDYDFDNAELRRIVWNTGASVPFGRWVTIDFGVGGSEFDKGIRWTPKVATGRPITVPGLGLTDATPILTALQDTTLGTSFVDFLGGFKVRITDNLVLSGSATTPLNNQGFRADAVGTFAIEGYL